jgi:hypothetical protein
MGVLTACDRRPGCDLFAGSRLTIKGPPRDFYNLCGAVTELGGGPEGWRLALGVIVVAAVLQMLFGLLKLSVE